MAMSAMAIRDEKRALLEKLRIQKTAIADLASLLSKIEEKFKVGDMAEEKKVVEFEQLTPEQQEDVRKELREALIKWRDAEINLAEIEIAISENVSRIAGVEEDIRKENARLVRIRDTLLGERAEWQKIPRGAERVTKARAYLESAKALRQDISGRDSAIAALNEAESNQERAIKEYETLADELERLESKLRELRQRARLV